MAKNIIPSSEIGATIRRRRKTLGLSQEQLAAKVGVSYQQLQRYENGATTLNVENFQRIAQALQMAPAAFFSVVEVRGEKQNDELLAPDEKNILRLFRNLSAPSDKKLIVSIMRRFGRKISPR